MDCERFGTDPATTVDNTTRAIRSYSKHDNGLLHVWQGCVWLNHPLSLNKEFSQAVLDK